MIHTISVDVQTDAFFKYNRVCVRAYACVRVRAHFSTSPEKNFHQSIQNER